MVRTDLRVTSANFTSSRTCCFCFTRSRLITLGTTPRLENDGLVRYPVTSCSALLQHGGAAHGTDEHDGPADGPSLDVLAPEGPLQLALHGARRQGDLHQRHGLAAAGAEQDQVRLADPTPDDQQPGVGGLDLGDRRVREGGAGDAAAHVERRRAAERDLDDGVRAIVLGPRRGRREAEGEGPDTGREAGNRGQERRERVHHTAHHFPPIRMVWTEPAGSGRSSAGSRPRRISPGGVGERRTGAAAGGGGAAATVVVEPG
jgi:hypothetical protein